MLENLPCSLGARITYFHVHSPLRGGRSGRGQASSYQQDEESSHPMIAEGDQGARIPEANAAPPECSRRVRQ